MRKNEIIVRAPFQETGTFDEHKRPILIDSQGVAFVHKDPVTTASIITLAGYACSLAWIAGGAWWLGLAGILADEIDGRYARKTGTATRLGGELDYAVDVTLTGLAAAKWLGPAGLALLPIVTLGQADLRARGERPSFGSARAAFMALGMVSR